MSYFHDSKARMSLIYCRACIMKRELVPLQIWPCTSFLFSPSKFNLPLKERLSVCVCVWVCLREAPRALLSSFWEQKHWALQAGPSRVLPCYLWKTWSVWIKQMMPRRTTTIYKKKNDSFPKPWKRAKGQTNQWQFVWYLAPSTDRPWSVWHECKCEKWSFLYM